MLIEWVSITCIRKKYKKSARQFWIPDRYLAVNPIFASMASKWILLATESNCTDEPPIPLIMATVVTLSDNTWTCLFRRSSLKDRVPIKTANNSRKLELFIESLKFQKPCVVITTVWIRWIRLRPIHWSERAPWWLCVTCRYAWQFCSYSDIINTLLVKPRITFLKGTE